MPLGCDKEVASNARRDGCGVCKGDGTSCRRSTVMFRDIPPTGNRLFILLLNNLSESRNVFS